MSSASVLLFLGIVYEKQTTSVIAKLRFVTGEKGKYTTRI